MSEESEVGNRPSDLQAASIPTDKAICTLCEDYDGEHFIVGFPVLQRCVSETAPLTNFVFGFELRVAGFEIIVVAFGA